MGLRTVAALLAATAVGLGAFGAHGLRERFDALPVAAEWWRTATFYLLVHAAAATVLPIASRGARLCLLGGATLFAGTLYAMALGAPTWLGAVTPIGGTALIVGWIWLAFASADSAARDVS